MEKPKVIEVTIKPKKKKEITIDGQHGEKQVKLVFARESFHTFIVVTFLNAIQHYKFYKNSLVEC